MELIKKLFDLTGKTIIVAGGAGQIGFSSPGLDQALLTQSSTPHVVEEDGAFVPDGPAPAWVSVLLINDTPSSVWVHCAE